MSLSEDEDTFFEDLVNKGTSEQDLEEEAREVGHWYYREMVYALQIFRLVSRRAQTCEEQRLLNFICILAHLP
jgi:hypothetical protein